MVQKSVKNRALLIIPRLNHGPGNGTIGKQGNK